MGSVSIGRMSRDDSQAKAGVLDTILNCKVNLFMMFVILTAYCLCRYVYLSQDGTNNIKGQRSGSFAPASPYKASLGSDLGIKSDQPVKLIDASYFGNLIAAALQEPRKRKMVDLTKNPTENTMQVLLNTWTEGSYSPVHKHPKYSEVFIVLEGALAFFVFDREGGSPVCHVLSSTSASSKRAIVVEADEWHAMTAAPAELGYSGHAVIFEVSSHLYNAEVQTKQLAPFAPIVNRGLDGDPKYFKDTLLPLCARASSSVV